jgi:hypothetical protein
MGIWARPGRVHQREGGWGHEGGGRGQWKRLEIRPNTGADWSEKVACELCRLLDLPHVNYDLATWKDKNGGICPTCVPTDGRLVHGNELLTQLLPEYPQLQVRRVSQHTLENVSDFSYT